MAWEAMEFRPYLLPGETYADRLFRSTPFQVRQEGEQLYASYNPVMGWPSGYYNHPGFQLRYINKMVPEREADMYKRLQELYDSSPAFQAALQECLEYNPFGYRVLSIGGGPGPCLTGLRGFLKDTGLLAGGMFSGCVADKWHTWAEAARDQGFGFVHMDCTQPTRDQPGIIEEIRTARIIILSYVIKVS